MCTVRGLVAAPRPARARLRARAALSILVWLVPVVVFGRLHARLEIDVENRALNSVGTREARDARRLQESFGADTSVLLGLAAAPGLALSAAERECVPKLSRNLSELEGVTGVELPQVGDEGLATVLVSVRSGGPIGEAGEIAERVVAAARESCPRTLSLYATGPALAELAIARALDREVRRVVPLAGLAMLLLLWRGYSKPVLRLLVLASSLGAILVTGGVFALLGHRRDPVSGLLDPVLLTVGVAASVHVVETYLRERGRRPAAEAAAVVRAELAVPTVLTTLTTQVGFLALCFSPIPAIGTFGVYASLGVAVAAATALWFLPGWLAAFVEAPRQHGALEHATLRARLLGRRLVAFVSVRGLVVLVPFAIVAGVLAACAVRVRVDNDPMRILDPSESFRRDTEWLARRLGGVDTIGMRGPAHSSALSPETGALLAARLAEAPGVIGFSGPPRMAGNGDVLVGVTLAPSGSSAREELFDRVEAGFAELGHEDVHLVGTAVRIARDSGNLVRGQIEGLALVVPLLALTMAIGLRSLRLGLLGLVPNVLPCVFLYGTLVLVDRPLSVSTVMIGSALMGLIVDDTIHLLHRYRKGLDAGRSRRAALADAVGLAGRPITVTSVVLAIGLGISAFGELETTIEFGVFAAATVLIAWMLGLFVLPALLLRRTASRPFAGRTAE